MRLFSMKKILMIVRNRRKMFSMTNMIQEKFLKIILFHMMLTKMTLGKLDHLMQIQRLLLAIALVKPFRKMGKICRMICLIQEKLQKIIPISIKNERLLLLKTSLKWSKIMRKPKAMVYRSMEKWLKIILNMELS